MIAGITIESATNALRIATGDEGATVRCITMRPRHASITGRLGDDRYVYGEGPDTTEAYVDLISRARRAVDA